MENYELLTFGLEWLAKHGVFVVVLLLALLPLLSVCVVGYALRVLERALSRGRK